MGYYRRNSYRSWRSRGWSGSSGPSKYSVLTRLFGDAVQEIRTAFIQLDESARDELLSDYGAIYGESAEKYARQTFPKWKKGSTNLSGQTMERLVELVPPYLSSEQRFSILQLVLARQKRTVTTKTVRINIKEPASGVEEAQNVLLSMSHDNALAELSESSMQAATWLYDDDITAARAMLAEAERKENDLIRSKAKRELELLVKTICTGQVRSANYSVELPSGRLSVIAYTPSKCFVATVCFGQNAVETEILRWWRDSYLVEKELGRRFIVWYYTYGERIARLVEKSKALKWVAAGSIRAFVRLVACHRFWRSR